MSLSLLTLNIEEDKHLDLILPYLTAQKFDAVCLQEVFEKNLEQLAEAANATAFYTPTGILNGKIWGEALLIRKDLPVLETFEKYYKGSDSEIPIFTSETPNAINRAILQAKFQKMGPTGEPEEYSLTTTHFTWTPNGKTTDEQQTDFAQLLLALDEVGETVLCGDFNAARGINPVFADLAKKYVDNIPAETTTTIDQNIHRVKGLQLVVDGMFSSPKYTVKNVAIISNLSDHCGVKGEVFLNE